MINELSSFGLFLFISTIVYPNPKLSAVSKRNERKRFVVSLGKDNVITYNLTCMTS